MVRRTILLAVVLTVAVAGCGRAPEVSEEAAAGRTAGSEAEQAPPPAMQAAAPDVDPANTETVTVTITVAGGAGGRGQSAGAGPGMGPGMGHGGNCPKTQLGNMLRATVLRPHGCVIGEVQPDGRGAKAGIRPGDSIVECDGIAVSCPRELMAELSSGQGKREVELTIRRPKADAVASTPEKAAPAGPAQQGAGVPEPEQPKSE